MGPWLDGRELSFRASRTTSRNVGTGDSRPSSGRTTGRRIWIGSKKGWAVWSDPPNAAPRQDTRIEYGVAGTHHPDRAATKRAFDAMLPMTKIDIAAIEAARHG